jgi:hypothetical protein
MEVSLAVEGWRGRQAELFGAGHGLLLALLRQADPVAAQAVHDAGRRKAMALGPLRVQPHAGDLARASLDIRVWDDGLARLLAVGCGLALDMEARVLGRAACVLGAEEVDRCELAGLLHLSGAPAGGGARVSFETPTLFSFGRTPWGRQRYGLLPEPALVVGSWLRAWVQAGGETFGAEMGMEWLEERVALRTVAGLGTRTVHTGHTALTGFVGRASYHWTGPEPWGPALLRALASFSAYCGTGAKTGYGCGVTMPLDPAGAYPEESLARGAELRGMPAHRPSRSPED